MLRYVTPSFRNRWTPGQPMPAIVLPPSNGLRTRRTAVSHFELTPSSSSSLVGRIAPASCTAMMAACSLAKAALAQNVEWPQTNRSTDARNSQSASTLRASVHGAFAR